jgi:hypothetical protein
MSLLYLQTVNKVHSVNVLHSVVFMLETREEPIPRFIPEAIGVVAFPLIPLDAGRFQSRLPHPATYGIACCTFRHDVGIALLTVVLNMIESVLPVNSSLKIVILP